jgi:hypothetical protein
MEIDEQIGRNLARLRGPMSQQDLARQMRELGWKWSQSTVWSIERGDRPLRLGEAVALARILGEISVSTLAWPEGAAVVKEQMHAVSQAWNDAVEALKRLDETQVDLAVVADQHSESLAAAFKDAVKDWLSRDGIDVFDEYQRSVEAEATAERIRSGVSETEARQLRERAGDQGEFWNALNSRREDRDDGKHPEAT